MNVEFDIKLTKSQKEAYNTLNEDGVKYLTLVMSRQSGKSVLMRILCIKWLFETNKAIGYVCKNFNLAKRMYRYVINSFPKDYISASNASDLIIESTTGAILQFYSAESGNSLRGFTFDYLICDEAAFYKEELPDGSKLWENILFPTIKAKGKKVIFVSTPCGKNGFFYDMYLRGLATKYTNHRTIVKTIYDDELVTEEEIKEIRLNINELAFNQEFLCQFLDSAITAFPSFEACFVANYKYPNIGEKVWIGVDLSSVGDDETILTVINEGNRVIQYNIMGSLDAKYCQILELINKWKPIATYIELNSIGEPIYNEIKKKVKDKGRFHGWTTTNASKNDIVGLIQNDIANKDIAFSDKDTELKQQFGVFTYTVTKAKNITYAAKPPYHDDRIMSLCMARKAKEDFKYTNITKSYTIIKERKKDIQ